MASGKIVELDPNTFESEVLTSDKPFLVDFWAEWCGPCKQLTPVLEQIAEENPDLARIGKLDVEAHPELASKYRIRSIPAMFVFKNGEVKEQIIGITPGIKETIILALEKAAG